MAKLSGPFFVLAGTASLCTVYLMNSMTVTERPVASHLSEHMKGPQGGGLAYLAMAPVGWRAYVWSPTQSEPAEDKTVPVVVTISKRVDVKPAVPPPARSGIPIPYDRASIPYDRASLVHELQRELRRVGCYDGALNDSWTLTTRTAMKAFTNRTNAILPVDKPDHILLALLRDYRGRVCDVPCPAGEGLARDGRCVANVILARKSDKGVQHSAPLPVAEQSRSLVTSVRSGITPAEPEVRESTNGSLALAASAPEPANPTRVAATEASRTLRLRAPAAPQLPSSTFGPEIFKHFDALGH